MTSLPATLIHVQKIALETNPAFERLPGPGEAVMTDNELRGIVLKKFYDQRHAAESPIQKFMRRSNMLRAYGS